MGVGSDAGYREEDATPSRERTPGERTLAENVAAGLGGRSQEDLDRILAKDPTGGGRLEDANVGPEKTATERTLAMLASEDANVILTDYQKANQTTPRGGKDAPGKIAVLNTRAGIESLSGIGAGSLSNTENFYGETYWQTSRSGQAYSVEEQREQRREGGLLGGTGQRGERFDSIEEFGFTPSQQRRYNELVDRGLIDPENPWATTSLYATEIIVGDDRWGVSPYNPATGESYDPQTIQDAIKFQRNVLMRSGFGGSALMVGAGTGPARDSNRDRMKFTYLSPEERREGSSGFRPQDGLTNWLTLEERLQVAELSTGYRRGINDPRDEANPDSYDETLFFGDFVL